MKPPHFPVFLPDATRGVVRSLTSNDLKTVGTEAIVVNTYHLMQTPGIEVLESYGGIKKFMNFSGLVASDSGGFQIMSLIHQKKVWGKLNANGLEFKWRVNGRDEKNSLTPEKSIATQFAIGSDIIVCFDYFTRPEADLDEQKLSVQLTIEWAVRCREEFERQIKTRKIPQAKRPQLMGVLQGGENRELRAACAKELVAMNFDLYGYGGWTMNSKGEFLEDLFAYNASLTPDDKPRFALGVGKPENLVTGTNYGYSYFDCVLPSRDARHGRLYTFLAEPANLDLSKPFYDYLYITRGQYQDSADPVSAFCQCPCCANYSRGYLHHLFKIQDALYWRLATLHNLFFYNSLIEILR